MNLCSLVSDSCYSYVAAIVIKIG